MGEGTSESVDEQRAKTTRISKALRCAGDPSKQGRAELDGWMYGWDGSQGEDEGETEVSTVLSQRG